ncbi:PREDICTED: serine/arginine repetitive matrix protein 1-like [Vollenhovia emeryi]|uniref:serine/arginine repetitive matrix protein 1-like n=1 Tax=Vollenhovia emeryi TaxID=411798 RepID=UPI0005F540D3|nr:PREDICTED: serine/arginine repetitive matrix protein 1-like [Vollenhovia emeryi]
MVARRERERERESRSASRRQSRALRGGDPRTPPAATCTTAPKVAPSRSPFDRSRRYRPSPPPPTSSSSSSSPWYRGEWRAARREPAPARHASRARRPPRARPPPSRPRAPRLGSPTDIRDSVRACVRACLRGEEGWEREREREAINSRETDRSRAVHRARRTATLKTTVEEEVVEVVDRLGAGRLLGWHVRFIVRGVSRKSASSSLEKYARAHRGGGHFVGRDHHHHYRRCSRRPSSSSSSSSSSPPLPPPPSSPSSPSFLPLRAIGSPAFPTGARRVTRLFCGEGCFLLRRWCVTRRRKKKDPGGRRQTRRDSEIEGERDTELTPCAGEFWYFAVEAFRLSLTSDIPQKAASSSKIVFGCRWLTIPESVDSKSQNPRAGQRGVDR